MPIIIPSKRVLIISDKVSGVGNIIRGNDKKDKIRFKVS